MAAPTVSVSQGGVVKPLNRLLQDPSKQSIGFLLGTVKEGLTTILQCSAIDNNFPDNGDRIGPAETNIQLKSLQRQLPVGLSVIGLYFVSDDEPSNSNTASKDSHQIIDEAVKTTLGMESLIIAHIHNEDSALTEDHFYLYNVNSSKAAQCDVKIASDSATQEMDLITFRVQANLDLNITYYNDHGVQESLTQKFNSLNNKVQSFTTLYHVQKSNVLIGQSDSDITLGPLNRDSEADDISQHIKEEDDGFSTLPVKGGKKPKRDNKNSNQVVDVQVLFRLSIDEDKEDSLGLVPVLHYQLFDDGCKRSSLRLPIDVPVMVHKNTPTKALGKIFADAICRQLRAMEQCLKEYYKEIGLSFPRPYHFKLPHVPYLLTIVYPVDLPDDKLETKRRELHSQFLLPLDRPIFRRANAYSYPGSGKDGGYLINTHIGLAPSGVENGHPSLVQGSYTYHHYMQDHFNDDKWGCAYRSLQTLSSWFRHQGYTQTPVPTHREIQQALVDVGDKKSSFVGSKQWIGSFEVSTVLNQLFGVTCKLMYVSSGADMAEKGRELSIHFQTQGTPVMIGGGVLAHTILGVDFSESSGAVKFLILDPHFTGSEDLKVIQDKGWCGWKGVDFWDQTAYYNMCLPQRSNEI
ncbi:ufm1-specific protease 2-like [Asterias rubens]|uniref:ufm1-specific protease 2-like n=1 Tax=Asterias rubens TaxID=7604 RepID=UPI00145569D1|nr:ufm1-specific protease 2-like [Asterias rubens]